MQRYTPFATTWDPFAEIHEMHRAVNRLFGATNGRSADVFPSWNVYANGDEAIVAAEVPGVDKDGLEISVTGNTFTLSGTRKSRDTENASTPLRQERFQGEFRRSLELPFNIQTDQVKATLRNGILQVRLPRAESDKPRKIQVEA